MPAFAADWQLSKPASMIGVLVTEEKPEHSAFALANFTGEFAENGDLVVQLLGEEPTEQEKADGIKQEVLGFARAPVQPERYEVLSTGDWFETSLPVELQSYAATVERDVLVRITRLSPDRLEVISRGPMLVSPEAMGMPWVLPRHWQDLGLSPDDTEVPVVFQLEFYR